MLTDTQENKILNAIIKFGPEVLSIADNDEQLKFYRNVCIDEKLNYPYPLNKELGEWIIPDEYLQMQIQEHLISLCPTENKERLLQELKLYEKYEMIPVLKAMKYLVDVMRNHKIVWGVGRGSSVASYALYLLGVHKIDSVKYRLPIEEFFKGEK